MLASGLGSSLGSSDPGGARLHTAPGSNGLCATARCALQPLLDSWRASAYSIFVAAGWPPDPTMDEDQLRRLAPQLWQVGASACTCKGSVWSGVRLPKERITSAMHAAQTVMKKAGHPAGSRRPTPSPCCTMQGAVNMGFQPRVPRSVEEMQEGLQVAFKKFEKPPPQQQQQQALGVGTQQAGGQQPAAVTLAVQQAALQPGSMQQPQLQPMQQQQLRPVSPRAQRQQQPQWQRRAARLRASPPMPELHIHQGRAVAGSPRAAAGSGIPTAGVPAVPPGGPLLPAMPGPHTQPVATGWPVAALGCSTVTSIGPPHVLQNVGAVVSQQMHQLQVGLRCMPGSAAGPCCARVMLKQAAGCTVACMRACMGCSAV